MITLSWLMSFFIYLSGIYVYSSTRKHLLMVLLSLEYMVLSLFLMMNLYFIIYSYDLNFIVFFIVFSVCEGALGLSILVSMIRSHGNDFFNSFSLSLC
uniref:NADH dehydrogenase subunit 4L n=1 Tax=Erianthus versicolor TaxID=470935 RepID=UPI00241123D7|nr:NADH dehydrogenase subunit 4L [Erianthus versicolor]WEL32789.1 NADH dehydrogenase subunit 4L [Erianthus versicolor]